VLVERAVGDELFQTGVCFFERLHPPQLTHAEMGNTFLPDVERRFAHAERSAHIHHGGAALRLP
jgi:hypothetical protein